MKKFIGLITLFISSFAIANSSDSLQFIQDYQISSNEPNHISYFSPDTPAGGLYTFTVNKTRQIHNIGLQSDTLTVICNGVITLIKAGQTGTCRLQKGEIGKDFIADADFINGTDGVTDYKVS